MTSSRNDPPPLGESSTRPKRRAVKLALGPQTFIKKGLARFDPHDPYYFAISLSWRMFGVLFVGVEFFINIVFAALYSLQPGSIANQGVTGFLGAFFFSLETLATVGYGEMYPATTYAHVISSLEILIGVIFTAIVTGLLFVRFSKPKAKVHYATNAVVTVHNGVPTLMLRIGNARNSLLHDTFLTLHVLTRSVSAEGVRHAIVVELPLLRSRVPIFAILYTLMHVIDETSPLYGLDASNPELLEMRFFLSVVARDPAIGQKVSDVHTFEGDSIRFGMRYVDAIRMVGTRKVVADYGLLSEIEPATLSSEMHGENEMIEPQAEEMRS